MNKLFNLVAILLILTLVSCKEEIEDNIDMGYDYFPAKIGYYQIYKVDSIVFDDYTENVDTFSYQVKMIIDEQFTNDDNLKSFRWKKFTKTDITNWEFNNNYTLDITNFNVQSVIENMRYINIVFPVSIGNSWNYNAMNISNKLNSLYTDIDFNQIVLGKNYDNCVKVIYQEEVNLIQEFVHSQTFSRGIGMIYRKDIYKEKKSNKIKGYNLEYQLMKYGYK